LIVDALKSQKLNLNCLNVEMFENKLNLKVDTPANKLNLKVDTPKLFKC
jgi:hypothetical protein